jgi:NADPH2:quinone reductase
MKAIIVREHGGPEALRLENIPPLMPGEGEVMIRVRAVTVNRIRDLQVSSGIPLGLRMLPIVPGWIQPAK